MGGYIALAGGIVGVVAYVPKIKAYFHSKRQRINTTEQLNEINNIYDETTPQNLKNALGRLREKRDCMLLMLKEEHITEGQFIILNQKISDYMDKIQRD